jgi:nucleoid-associated protein YgaU
LPQPIVSDEDERILNAPRRAATEANANIAEAQEAAREARLVAEARTVEAESAEEKANADELIAAAESVKARQDVAWCVEYKALGEPCWLIRAAETGSMPTVLGEIPEGVVVPVPVDPEDTVQVPAETSDDE